MRTSRHSLSPSFLELLEPRIAPAGLADIEFQAAPVSSSILLRAGQGLATSDSGGSYLLYVERGEAMIFTTDLNANNKVDFNEITGIAAGAGLRLVSFVDINGDIVTNLGPNGRLTDSDGDASNGLDGRVVLNNRIDSIVLRSITAEELPVRPGETVPNRLAKSSYSIFGNIYAGGGIGSVSQPGLQIDTTGFASQEARFGILTLAGEAGEYPIPSVGYIVTGSATSGQQFSFGTSPDFGNGRGQSLRGDLVSFVAATGQSGGDVIGVRAVTFIDAPEEVVGPETGEITEVGFVPTPIHMSGIITGDGGFGARGGNIAQVTLDGDVGGLLLKTGSGGNGERGGDGGNITGLAISNSVNSRVVIETGSGGDGLVGVAGQAGRVQFDGTVELMGRIAIGLGRGGDAFGDAGAGTSIAESTFRDVRPGDFLPAQIITTWRQPGDIGTSQPLFDPATGDLTGYVPRSLDFDGDGFYDAVFLTDVPNQLVVAFGSADPATPGTFDPLRSIYLDSPVYANAATRTSAVVALDANGDGLPDIVTGQSGGNGYNGVMVHVNRGFDPLTGAWLGFALPRYSPLPDTGNLRDTTPAIVNLAAGDFNRDGVVDLAVITVARSANTSPPFFGVLTMMSGLTGADGRADGYFAADFGKGTGNVATKLPVVPFTRGNVEDFTFVMHATAGQAGDADSDVLGVLSRGGREGGPTVTNALLRGEALNLFSMRPTIGVVTESLIQQAAPLSYSQRVLDGDPERWVGYGQRFNVVGADFVFLDADFNGVFDAVVVGQPTGDDAPSFLVAATLQGSYLPAANLSTIAQLAQTDPGGATPGGTYFGIALSEFRSPTVVVDSVLGNNFEDRQVLKMVAGNFDPTYNPNDPTSVWSASFALTGINFLSNPTPPVAQMAYFSVAGFGQYNGDFTVLRRGAPAYTPVGEPDTPTRTALFDFYAQGPNLTAGLVNELAPVDVFWGLVSRGANPRPLWFPLAASTLELTAGDGGWSLLGRGGSGGALGGGTLVPQENATFLGSINSFGHVLQGLLSGSGGFGLLGGGASGSISSVVVTSQTNFVPPEVRVVTAAGGSSFLGAGGKAGNISQFDFRTSLIGTTVIFADDPPVVTLRTGSGGFGLTGGSGGDVFGRGDAQFADTDSDSTIISTGQGGYGVSRGGDGGDVERLVSIFRPFGGVAVVTGDGADSAAGAAGAGGDLALRPSSLVNSLQSGLSLVAGAGGNGLAGGAGGNIRNFINEPTTSSNPSTLQALAGDGGDGVTRDGGAGGSIVDFNVTASAVGGIGLVSAGSGGVGSASFGGAGGSLRGVVVSSEAGATVGLAGAGGDGLRAGGVGGSITGGISLNAGGQDDARVIAMAGAGGNAYGVSLRTVEREGTARNPAFAAMFALGTADGRGGNGGSINDFRQPSATLTSTDLVAGNGGSTISHGRISDAKPLVGLGGSITRVNLAGDAGRIDPDVAIRSYDPDFVAQVRNGETTVINDKTPGVGNVGVLVGAAGAVRNDLPVSGGRAGSVDGFVAKNVMSMVAGSVDRVAAITSVSGLRLQNGGTVLGALKDSYFDPNDNLFTVFDAATNPRPSSTAYFAPPASPPLTVPPGFEPYVFAPNASSGSSLIDGAVLTFKYSGPSSNRVFVTRG